MNKTSIEWVRNPDGSQGFTWNPVTGCLNNCPYCYARRLANGRLRQRYLWNDNFAPVIEASKSLGGKPVSLPMLNPFYPRFWDLRLIDPYAVKKPCGIFVVDMGELFGDWIPEDWQEKIFAVIKTCPQHRFYLLTKWPQNLDKFSPFPDNCWVGVTATDARMARNALHELLRIEAKVKYISFEPLLERIYIDCAVGIDWLIIGAQTKPYKPPKIEWVEEVVRAADKAGIPVFLKDNLKPLLETLDITRTSFGRLTSLTVEAIKDIQGLPRQRGWYELRQEIPE